MDPHDLPLEHVARAPDDVPDVSDDRASAVLVLHGRETDEFDLLPLAEALPAPAHVLSLRAPIPGQRGHVWYDLDLSAGGLHESQPGEGFRESLDLLHEFAERAPDAYPVEVAGLLGFSQGGITSLAALLERPDLYGWAAALHAYLPASHDPRERDFGGVAGRGAFLAAGEADTVIPASRTEDAAAALRAADLDVTFGRYPGGHGVSPDERADLAGWIGERLG
jgi:phospholipase/carboxylesterase